MRWTRMGRFATVSVIVSMGVIAGPAPAHAAFPGENGRIVFDTVSAFWNGEASSSEIYSIRPDGSDQRQLTDVGPGTAAWHPAFSPTANRIAYVVSADGSDDQVWIMRANGSHQHPLLDEPGWSQTGPSFTPGGGRVLYARCGFYVAFYWTCKIVSVRLDGSDRRTIIGGTWHPSDPVMSPDGSTLAYVSDAGGFDSRIWLADAAGGDRHALGPTFGVERISWSPDGAQLAFTGDNRHGAIFTMDIDGTDLARIVPGSLFPSWSPDGTRIASKVERPSGLGPLRTTKPDGSDPVIIGDPYLGIGFSDWGVAR
jgi:Tol biopolymer transport system component